MRHLFSMLAAIAFVAAATPTVAHDYRAGDIEIGHPWTRATPPAAKVGGGYLELTNAGDTADRLLGGSSPVAARVEIHNMEMTDGIMKMRPVPEGVEIPAGETVNLAPGGYHLMLLELKQPITEGEMVPVTLEFEQAGAVDVELVAGPIGSTATGHGNATSSSHEGHE
ncbi:copper chaperone PCu(A)C [Nitratireductor sp. L15S-10]|uniref:copper chaperone PCu(A)C n=1 Tax=Nitratireductor sp. L15S-10 TaxID=3034028 RepID=UPI003857444F